ncbi:YaaW family protein [Aeromonas caviae]|uniref:YaaW family protein n=1 Tax=Aeromonas caviae TaxID=648 RepID=UPI002B47C990|nr:ubiquinol-cytochrome C chaperone family protein [Aeromonas caviae]
MSTGDNQLLPVLRNASDSELAPLVKYITAAFSNSLESENYYKTHYPKHGKYTDLIAQELCAFGGNTFVNLFRGSGPEWKAVVIDVADKLDAKYETSWGVERIELAVLAAITRKAWSDMDAAQRKTLLAQMDLTLGSSTLFPEELLMKQLQSSRFSSLLLASLIANVFASQLLGRTVVMTATSFMVSRGAASLLGPIGWVITGLWTAFDLAGPAYRVTVPAVVQVALLRQRIHATKEADKAWWEYHRWQDEKDADSWVANLFRMAGLSTAASIRRERNMAFDQGVAAGQQQATEDYADQILKKMNEIQCFEKRCEAMLAVAFACAREESVAPSDVRSGIETCCLGMMGGHLSPALQTAVNRLTINPPDIRDAFAQAVEQGIPETEITALMTVLRETFCQHAGAN